MSLPRLTWTVRAPSPETQTGSCTADLAGLVARRVRVADLRRHLMGGTVSSRGAHVNRRAGARGLGDGPGQAVRPQRLTDRHQPGRRRAAGEDVDEGTVDGRAGIDRRSGVLVAFRAAHLQRALGEVDGDP